MKYQTKNIIADAFVALAKKKSIDKITVKDLVEHCDISRQTFYYHFQDILEVIEWHTQRVEEEIALRARNADSMEAAVRIVVGAFIEHYPLFGKLRDSQKRAFVEKLVMDSLRERFWELVREVSADKPLDITGAEAEALISFFSFGLAGMMTAHCQKKLPDEAELTQQVLAVLKRISAGMQAPERLPHGFAAAPDSMLTTQ